MFLHHNSQDLRCSNIYIYRTIVENICATTLNLTYIITNDLLYTQVPIIHEKLNFWRRDITILKVALWEFKEDHVLFWHARCYIGRVLYYSEDDVSESIEQLIFVTQITLLWSRWMHSNCVKWKYANYLQCEIKVLITGCVAWW